VVRAIDFSSKDLRYNFPVFQVIRTKRKTFALVINPDGSLTVRAPLRATKKQINSLIEKHDQWIRTQQEKVLEANRNFLPKKYTAGETFLYLGSRAPLEIVERQAASLVLKDKFYIASRALPSAQETFKEWYRKQAYEVFSQRTAQHASQNGFHYNTVRVKDMKTRWGSCSSKGNLNFNLRLVMAPLPVIDYVIIHELCHLKVKNHSKDFWSLVGSHMLGYKEHLSWLKHNGHTLIF